ncbi:unnamed protein product [Cochlearia groenlandica]
MTRSLFFLLFTISLLLSTASTSSSSSSSPWNATTTLKYGGCSPGDIMEECLKTVENEEEAVLRQTPKPKSNYLSLKTPQRQPVYGDCKRLATCIGIANSKKKDCPWYKRCRL